MGKGTLVNVGPGGGPCQRGNPEYDRLDHQGFGVESRRMPGVATVLQLTSVSRNFGAQHALGPIDLAVGEGEILALIGPSGSGKTTLLRLMIGLLRPQTGQVRFRDRQLEDANLTQIRERIGYVVQEGGLFPHLDARANVTLMARTLRWPTARIDARVHELLTLARLPREILDRYPAQLSGGQRQRVSLLRALMLDPEVLLLDEPLGALDPLVRAELQDDLAVIFKSLRKTVVLVTHDLAEAAFFSSNLLLLREGRIVQRGSLADLVQRPVEPFVSTFVRAQRLLPGSPPDGVMEAR
jgi:osmoprotectant transport system ATP-binding protein